MTHPTHLSPHGDAGPTPGAAPPKRLTLTSLRVSHLGPLSGDLDLGALDPGLIVISGPNETGKSTLIAGLRAAFFERHTARNKALRSLQPHGTADAPELWVGFQHDGLRYELHKRFLVKPVAELRAEGQPAPLVGDEAEAAMRAILGAQEPGKQGARLDDMGLWGLLWVGQDEAAYTDPGQHLGHNVRGTIQEAMEHHLGALTGGGQASERLRTRAREEYERYWTDKTGKPSGEYRQALQAVEEHQAAVDRARARLDDTRDLRASIGAVEGLYRDMTERRIPELRARAEETEAQEALVTERQEAVDRAQALVDQAWSRVEAARARLAERRTLAEEAARALAVSRALAEDVGELEPVVASAQEEARAAAAQVEEAEAAHRTAQAEHARARALLDAAERHAQRQALEAKRRALARARAELAEVAEELRGALAEDGYKAVQRAHEARREARAALERVATRFELSGPSDPPGSPRVLRLGREEEVDVPLSEAGGAGAPGEGAAVRLRLVPAGEGLRDAVGALREAERALAEALHPLGLAPGPEARSAARALHARRSEAETRLRLAQEELDEVAPQGLEALRAELQAVLAEVASLQEREARTQELEAAIQRAEAEAQEAGVTPAALTELEGLNHQLEVARATRDARATRVVITALRATRVRWEAHEGEAAEGGAPARALAQAETDTRQVTRATTLYLGDEARVRVEPGGERLADVELEVADASRRLSEALAALGCEGLDAARARAKTYEEARKAADAARAARDELAPDASQGGETWARRRRDAEARARALEERERRATRASERVRVAEARRDEHPVTAEALARVEELGRAVDEARAVVGRLAARIVPRPGGAERSPEGAPWTFAEPGVARVAPGLEVSVTPGEGGAAEAALAAHAQARWERTLEEAGVESLEAAGEAWRRWLTLRERARGLEDKAAALEAELAHEPEEARGPGRGATADETAGETAGELPDEPPDVATARAAWEAAERALEAAREARDGARGAASQARERAAVLEAQLGGKRAALEDEARAAEAAVGRLEAAREAVADEALERAVERGEADVRQARAALDAATAARDEAAFALVEPDAAARARAALEKARAQAEESARERARLVGQLESALSEGRYETWKASEAALEEARERLAGVERRARAARRLWQTLSDEYDSYQRRFLAPIVRRARPYLKAVRPESDLRMTPDFKVGGLVRRGMEEEFQSLSGGTREQLSVIVRLAFAGMLAETHGALPLILDDTMGWTDDERFGKMVRILEDAARSMQILVLTCHPSRFAALDAARTIDLGRLAREARRR